MSRIRSRDTLPELTVRRLVHKMGFRYRLHVPSLPGRPDLVFPKLRKIIEVRGCFWHQHQGCIDSHLPKTRHDYWLPKLQRNRDRDGQNLAKLENLGWRVLIVWECEATVSQPLGRKIKSFLKS